VYPAVNSICLFRLSAIGDVCLCVAVVRSLQAAFPQAKITWVISRPAFELVEGLQGVEFIVIRKPSGVMDYLALRKQFRTRRFDVLLAMQASLRANLIYPFIKATRKIGFDAQRARDAQGLFTNETIPFAQEHLLDSFLRFATAMGAHEHVIDFSPPLDDAHRRGAIDILNKSDKPIMLVNACASKAERDWPLDRLLEVLRYAQQKYNAQLVLIGGNAQREVDTARAIQQQLTLQDLVGSTGMKQLAAIIEAADVLLAPDTGPVHIARAVGTPVIGLYAVAPSWLSGPYGAMEYCVDHFNEAVKDILHQDPESVPWKTRVHDPRAMQLITVAEVTSMLDSLMQDRAGAG
jgi:heptosyltransferase I